MANHGATETTSSRQPAVGHLVGVPILAATAVALLVLTAITVAAIYVDLGAVNLWIAMTIATIKAALVCMYFMHLRWDRPFNVLAICGTLLFVLLFIGLAMTDSVAYRDEIIPPDSKEYAPAISPDRG